MSSCTLLSRFLFRRLETLDSLNDSRNRALICFFLTAGVMYKSVANFETFHKNIRIQLFSWSKRFVLGIAHFLSLRSVFISYPCDSLHPSPTRVSLHMQQRGHVGSTLIAFTAS